MQTKNSLRALRIYVFNTEEKITNVGKNKENKSMINLETIFKNKHAKHTRVAYDIYIYPRNVQYDKKIGTILI